MIENHIKKRGIVDPSVLDALITVKGNYLFLLNTEKSHIMTILYL